jgi:hypothetical protein
LSKAIILQVLCGTSKNQELKETICLRVEEAVRDGKNIISMMEQQA